VLPECSDFTNNLSETYIYHECSAYCDVRFQILLICPVSLALYVKAKKLFGLSFHITTLNPKTYHELQNVKDNMNLFKTNSLKVCNMIMPSQKNIFLLPSVENLTACMGQSSNVNAELRCGGGSDWME
jgi:hypothetical protein